MIVEEKNRLKKERDKEMIKLIGEALEFLNIQKEFLEQQIIKEINQNEKLKQIKEILTSIKGIGDITAAILMTEVPELGKLGNNL